MELSYEQVDRYILCDRLGSGDSFGSGGGKQTGFNLMKTLFTLIKSYLFVYTCRFRTDTVLW